MTECNGGNCNSRRVVPSVEAIINGHHTMGAVPAMEAKVQPMSLEARVDVRNLSSSGAVISGGASVEVSEDDVMNGVNDGGPDNPAQFAS